MRMLVGRRDRARNHGPVRKEHGEEHPQLVPLLDPRADPLREKNTLVMFISEDR